MLILPAVMNVKWLLKVTVVIVQVLMAFRAQIQIQQNTALVWTAQLPNMNPVLMHVPPMVNPRCRVVASWYNKITPQTTSLLSLQSEPIYDIIL